MSVKELFVKRVPLFAEDDIVHNEVGRILKKVIEDLKLGEFEWDIYSLKNSRCVIGTTPEDRTVDTTGLLTFKEEGAAFVMCRQKVEVSYCINENGRRVIKKRTLKFRVNRVDGFEVHKLRVLTGK